MFIVWDTQCCTDCVNLHIDGEGVECVENNADALRRNRFDFQYENNITTNRLPAQFANFVTKLQKNDKLTILNCLSLQCKSYNLIGLKNFLNFLDSYLSARQPLNQIHPQSHSFRPKVSVSFTESPSDLIECNLDSNRCELVGISGIK